MIQIALANTSVQADLWSHLKSMEYAIGRSMSNSADILHPLDRDRLCASVDFIRGLITLSPVKTDNVTEYLLATETNIPRYVPNIDIRKVCKDLPDFEAWGGSSLSFGKKMNSLLNKIEEFAGGSEQSLIPPEEALKALGAIISEILEQIPLLPYSDIDL